MLPCYTQAPSDEELPPPPPRDPPSSTHTISRPPALPSPRQGVKPPLSQQAESETLATATNRPGLSDQQQPQSQQGQQVTFQSTLPFISEEVASCSSAGPCQVLYSYCWSAQACTMMMACCIRYECTCMCRMSRIPTADMHLHSAVNASCM